MKSIQLLAALALFATAGAPQSPEAPLLHDSLRFAGIEWHIKDSGARQVGPGHNWFSSGNVRLDAGGQLHLQAKARDGSCVAAEAVAVPSLGYGTYEFTVATNLDNLAKNLVLGLFTWDDTSNQSFHREIDVELGRWGRENNADAQFVIQPYTIPSNIWRFSLRPGLRGSVHQFIWAPRRVSFRSEGLEASGVRSILQEYVFERMIPEPGQEQTRVNLWCMDSKAPADGTSEVVLSRFRFTPLR